MRRRISMLKNETTSIKPTDKKKINKQNRTRPNLYVQIVRAVARQHRKILYFVLWSITQSAK